MIYNFDTQNKKLIAKITDQDLGLNLTKNTEPALTRVGARGIILNKAGEIAILFKSAKNEYKLPGGGIDKNESTETAFKRECIEESGCDVEIVEYLGYTLEEKSKNNFVQMSHVFFAKQIGEIKAPELTEEELGDGAQALWFPAEKALELVSGSYNNLKDSIAQQFADVYSTKFIILRDTQILQYFIKNKNMLTNIKSK